MLKALRSTINKLNTSVWANSAFALLIVTYILLGLRAANNIWFTMDEGSYLFKGYWFLTGEASPFVINGPIANKPPLAFLIPGLSQLIQPGIASGRVMNVLLLAGGLVGIALTIRRWHNPWWGNLAIALVAINPTWVDYYTRVMTQTPAIFLMVWAIYFATDAKGRTSRLMIGATLSVLLLLTRHNLAPFTVLLFLYMAWEYDPKRAIIVFLPAGALFIAVNAFYWPGIYTLFWYRSLPRSMGDVLLRLFGLAAPAMVGNNGQSVDHTLIQTIQELFGSARISLSASMLALAGLVMLNKGRNLPNGKLFVFLTINFWVLTLVHTSVVFDKSVLLYSYPAYLLFWAPTIFIILPDLAALIRDADAKPSAWFMVFAFVVMCAGIAMHLYPDIADPALNFLVPRVQGFSLQAGDVELWRYIVNKFGIEYRTQEYLIPALLGAAVGTVLVISTLAVTKFTRKSVWMAVSLLVVFSILLTPTQTLSGNEPIDECRSDTLGTIQRVGDQINEQVKPDSLFFWGAHSSPTVGVMLYVNGARIFPEQLNGQFYYRPDLSLEASENSIFWSDAQAREWLRKADYLISDPGHLIYWDEMLSKMPEVGVDQAKPIDPLEPCNPKTSLYIFRLRHP